MTPKLSICLITYNHEKFLAQCLDGIIAQQCNFPIEIVIGEDKSTDSTPAIIAAYQNKYPELIRLVTSEQNVGMVQNWRRTINAGKGEYIAIIEGDDFWTSPLKLQKQVDFLDAHPDFALSFHDVDVIFGPGVPEVDSLTRFKGETVFTIEDIITRNWFVPTCSIVIRKSMLADFPEWTKPLKAIDLVVQLMATSNGKAGYIAEKMGTYRIHAAGQSQVQWLGRENIIEFTFIEILKGFDIYSKGKYKTAINERLQRAGKMLLVKNNPYSKYYFKAMFELIRLNPAKNISLVKDWIILNLVPNSVYRLYRRVK